MNDTISLNRILGIFSDIANREKMLNDFSSGKMWNVGASRELLFPYLFVEEVGEEIEYGDGVGFRTIIYTFNLYVMDKIKKGDPNWEEALSDTLFIINTILAEMAQHPFYRDMGIKHNANVKISPCIEKTDDNVNGHMATIYLKVPFRYTYCNTPIEPISGWTSSFNNSIAQYRLQGSQGPQGNFGPQGNQGPGSSGGTGSQGFQGFQGNIGLQGSQGNTGSDGVQGYQGPATIQTGLYWSLATNPSQTLLGGRMWTNMNGLFATATNMRLNENSFNTGGSSGPWNTIITSWVPGTIIDIDLVQQNMIFNTYAQVGYARIEVVTAPQYSSPFYSFTFSTVTFYSPEPSPASQIVYAFPKALYRGVTGSQGAQGFQGFQGNQGWQGFQGNQGFQGWQGWQGFQGWQGSQGDYGGWSIQYSIRNDNKFVSGQLSINDAALSNATSFLISATDSNSQDIDANNTVYQTLVADAQSGGGKPLRFRIFGNSSKGGQPIYYFYQSSTYSVNSNGLVINNATYSGGSNLTNDNTTFLASGWISFMMPPGATGGSGNQGFQGWQGPTGFQGPAGSGGGGLTFSACTTVYTNNLQACSATISVTSPIQTQQSYSLPITGTISTSTGTINWTASNVFSYNVATSSTISFVNNANGQTIVVALKQSTSGGMTASFNGVLWPGGVTPSITSTANKTDIFTFMSIAGTIYGSYVKNF